MEGSFGYPSRRYCLAKYLQSKERVELKSSKMVLAASFDIIDYDLQHIALGRRCPALHAQSEHFYPVSHHHRLSLLLLLRDTLSRLQLGIVGVVRPEITQR